MLYDEPAMTSNWSEISLGSMGPDYEQEFNGRLQFRGGSRSTSESESIGNDVDLSQKQFAKPQAKNDKEDQTNDIKRPDNSYAYQLGMMFVHGAAKVVNNVADGGQRNRDAIKQLRVELDDSRLKCDKLERDVENARQWLAYYQNINGGLQNQMEENEQKFSLEQRFMREKLIKSEQDAESCREALAEVTKMKDVMEGDAREAKSTVARMKKQVEDAQKKIAEFQEIPVILPQPNVALTSTSTQVDFNPLKASSTSPQEQLLLKLKRKEAQLKDAATALQVSFSQGDTLRHQLITSLKSMRSQTIEMRQSRTALNSAMKELTDLKALVQEEKQEKEKVESQLLQERKNHNNTHEKLEDKKTLLVHAQKKVKEEQILTNKKLKANQKLMYELILTHLAQNLVSSVIHDAHQTEQKEVFLKNFKALEKTSNTLSQRLLACEHDAESLQIKMTSLQLRLREKDIGIEECCETIKNLQLEIQQLKKELDVKSSSELSLQKSLKVTEAKLSQAQQTYEDEKRNGEHEISMLVSQLQVLQDKNFQLEQQVRQCSLKPSFNSVSVEMTALQGSNIPGDKMITEGATKKKKEFKDQTTSTDQEIENAPNNSSQQLYIAKLENEVEELKRKNFRLGCALQERENELYSNNRSVWQVHDDCRKLDWQCRHQHWKIQELRKENMELRIYIEKQPADFVTSSNSAHFEQSKTAAQLYQPTCYPTYHNKAFIHDENTTGKALETIEENEERSPTSLSTNSSKETTCLRSEVTHGTPQEEPCTSKQISEDDGARFSAGNFHYNKKILQEQVLQKMKRKTSDDRKSRQRYESESTDVAPDDTSALTFDDLSSPSNSYQRRVGIPMPERIYNKILAGMDVPSWTGEVAFSQDDGYSSSSCYSIAEELRPRQLPVAESADSAISERPYVHLTDEKVDDETERHYYVTYNGVQFDLANLSIPEIRNVASASGAIASQQGMNDFHYFLAKRIEEMDKNPCWNGAHNLGSPSVWLSLQKKEE